MGICRPHLLDDCLLLYNPSFTERITIFGESNTLFVENPLLVFELIFILLEWYATAKLVHPLSSWWSAGKLLDVIANVARDLITQPHY